MKLGRGFKFIVLFFVLTFLVGCELDLEEILFGGEDTPGEEQNDRQGETVTAIHELHSTEYFRPGALEHILEGELNGRGQAVGFHYDQLPSKKGEIISGTETDPNDHGVFEAEIEVEGVKKTSNQGKSSFFPNDWDTQEIVDAINEVYENREHLTGNTYGGLTKEGVQIHMYLDNDDFIISAFPVY